eukprot:Gregarina_sp_Poly_1__713@NODE_116_length_13672_cov_23_062992_g103_i0_p3_GENE_NODE_116_length_13672_cov_23_062992_g103_i0NODE_116_length_13672_cov_23_062992_g103_i0_p3_ORF_typecomplete_len601_score91_85_NODE_116_length_13672_cov_23_062992_g103_i061047906
MCGFLGGTGGHHFARHLNRLDPVWYLDRPFSKTPFGKQMGCDHLRLERMASGDSRSALLHSAPLWTMYFFTLVLSRIPSGDRSIFAIHNHGPFFRDSSLANYSRFLQCAGSFKILTSHLAQAPAHATRFTHPHIIHTSYPPHPIWSQQAARDFLVDNRELLLQIGIDHWNNAQIMKPISDETETTSPLVNAYRVFSDFAMEEKSHSRLPSSSHTSFAEYERRLLIELALQRVAAAMDLTGTETAIASTRGEELTRVNENESDSFLQLSQEVSENPLFQSVQNAFQRDAYKNRGLIRKLVNQVCRLVCQFKYERIPPQYDALENPYVETVFEFDDDDAPKPLDWPSFGLPFGCRLARVEEVEENPEKFKHLLQNFEMSMLQDGILCGPQYGYRVQRHFLSNFQLSSALIAIPQFEEIPFLPLDLKFLLLFKYFDKGEIGMLPEVEALVWFSFCCLDLRELFDGDELIGWTCKFNLPRSTSGKAFTSKKFAFPEHKVTRVYVKLPEEIIKLTDQEIFGPNFLILPSNLLRKLADAKSGPVLTDWSDVAQFMHQGLGVKLLSTDRMSMHRERHEINTPLKANNTPSIDRSRFERVSTLLPSPI